MKKLIKILLLLFTICTLSTNMGFAQSTVGDPMPGVPISLEGDPGSVIIARTTTDVNGKFACELKEGKYKLNISYSQIERVLQNVIGFAPLKPAEFKIDNKMVDNIEISLLLCSKSSNAKENIIAKTSVDKESGALSINIPKGGALISGIISYKLKSDGNNTSNDLKGVIIANSPVAEVCEVSLAFRTKLEEQIIQTKFDRELHPPDKIINQQPDSPIDTIPYTIICWSVANSGIWDCGATSFTCDDLYSSAIYEGSPNVWWECYAIVLTNPDIDILLNREKDGGASFEIDGEVIPIGSDAFVSLLAEKAKDAKKRNELETFMKKDKGFVSDKRLKEISKALGIPITIKKEVLK